MNTILLLALLILVYMLKEGIRQSKKLNEDTSLAQWIIQNEPNIDGRDIEEVLRHKKTVIYICNAIIIIGIMLVLIYLSYNLSQLNP